MYVFFLIYNFFWAATLTLSPHTQHTHPIHTHTHSAGIYIYIYLYMCNSIKKQKTPNYKHIEMKKKEEKYLLIKNQDDI